MKGKSLWLGPQTVYKSDLEQKKWFEITYRCIRKEGFYIEGDHGLIRGREILNNIHEF